MPDYAALSNIFQIIASAATAAGFFFIVRQSRLTKVQINQTQNEIENMRRPWLGQSFIRIYSDGVDDVAEFAMKNYGQVPAMLSGVKKKWSKREFSKKDLYTEVADAVNNMYLPQQDVPYYMHGKDKFMRAEPIFDLADENSLTDKFYFGILFNYEYPTISLDKPVSKKPKSKLRESNYGVITEGFLLKDKNGDPFVDKHGVLQYGARIIDAWSNAPSALEAPD
jgi:hypothetical protein